jgi:hypothetical protein
MRQLLTQLLECAEKLAAAPGDDWLVSGANLWLRSVTRCAQAPQPQDPRQQRAAVAATPLLPRSGPRTAPLLRRTPEFERDPRLPLLPADAAGLLLWLDGRLYHLNGAGNGAGASLSSADSSPRATGAPRSPLMNGNGAAHAEAAVSTVMDPNSPLAAVDKVRLPALGRFHPPPPPRTRAPAFPGRVPLPPHLHPTRAPLTEAYQVVAVVPKHTCTHAPCRRPRRSLQVYVLVAKLVETANTAGGSSGSGRLSSHVPAGVLAWSCSRVRSNLGMLLGPEGAAQARRAGAMGFSGRERRLGFVGAGWDVSRVSLLPCSACPAAAPKNPPPPPGRSQRLCPPSPWPASQCRRGWGAQPRSHPLGRAAGRHLHQRPAVLARPHARRRGPAGGLDGADDWPAGDRGWVPGRVGGVGVGAHCVWMGWVGWCRWSGSG